MSTGMQLILCLIPACAALLRLRIWSRRSSRPMTLALFALVAFGLLTLPVDRIDSTLTRAVSAANLADLLGDLCGVLAACYLCIHVAQAWERRRANRYITLAALAAAAILILTYALSAAPTTPARHIWALDGWADVYAYTVAAVQILTGVLVFATVLAIRPLPPRDRWTLLLMAAAALFGIVAGLRRVVEAATTATVTSALDSLPPAMISVGLYGIAAMVNYVLTGASPSIAGHYPERHGSR
jgi:hypothetical protein